jgi:CelD/BcsL family acetyltransferase involved in cellulose biosynthesis
VHTALDTQALPAPPEGWTEDRGVAWPVDPGRPLAATDDAGALTATVAGIALSVHTDLRSIEAVWRAFEEVADRGPFQAFGWLGAWQRHIAPHRQATLAVTIGRDGGDGPLFMLPLAIERIGPMRRLMWLGSELCDYNAPLLSARFAATVDDRRFVAVWQGLLALLRADPRTHFDLIDLQKMPETVGGQRNPFMALAVRDNPSGAYVATLGSDWKTFYAARRSAATRKTERRHLKRLGEQGPVNFTEAGTPADREATLGALIAQKRRLFARMGVDDLFARAGHTDFYRDVAANPDNRDFVHVSRLDVGDTVAAASVGLRHRHCYYLVLSSYDDGKLAQYGPGRAHLHALLRHAIDRGFTSFDFTIGDEPYKRDWCDTEVRLHDHLAATTLHGWALAALAVAYRRAKRLIKRSPALWQAFSKARALVGSKAGSRGRGASD